MHLNDFIIKDYLPQREPMLMLHKILTLDKELIEVVPAIPLKDAPLWVLLESMGQASQLLWAITENKGDYYVVKMDRFWKSKDLPDRKTIIRAKKDICYNHLFRAEIKLLSEEVEYAAVTMTHFYNELGHIH